ncbi:uncharacterized protein LOC132299831 [Cornus florida]|uniref:uncharacterized protein LOC132299831 n=1 Tax=Cornus florida TaxID=4283 RepID=UPI00289C0E2F|nr:uncharacterized protein LOC132299831 [Cornus florida]
MDSAGVTQLSAEGVRNLQEGISLLLSRWAALQLAVENEWGGRDSRLKPQHLADDIFNWLTQSTEPLYIDDLEDLLDEFMLSLNTEIDDGSIEEVAEKLMVMHEECLDGNYQSIESLKEPNPPGGAIPPIRQAIISDDDDSSDDAQSLAGNLSQSQITKNDDSSEMAVDGLESQPNSDHKDMMVDNPRPNEAAETEDGWTVVSSSRRNRGRRN